MERAPYTHRNSSLTINRVGGGTHFNPDGTGRDEWIRGRESAATDRLHRLVRHQKCSVVCITSSLHRGGRRWNYPAPKEVLPALCSISGLCQTPSHRDRALLVSFGVLAHLQSGREALEL